jgi:hypothetical protein
MIRHPGVRGWGGGGQQFHTTLHMLVKLYARKKETHAVAKKTVGLIPFSEARHGVPRKD